MGESQTKKIPLTLILGDSERDNVVGCGNFGSIKIVVSVRPDRTVPNKPDESVFANDVFSAFGEKNDLYRQ